MRHHELVIIGTGSGNSLITPELAGLDIAIVEEGTFGGTCLNVGCIPTKMLVLPSDRVLDAAAAARLGVSIPTPKNPALGPHAWLTSRRVGHTGAEQVTARTRPHDVGYLVSATRCRPRRWGRRAREWGRGDIEV